MLSLYGFINITTPGYNDEDKLAVAFFADPDVIVAGGLVRRHIPKSHCKGSAAFWKCSAYIFGPQLSQFSFSL